MACCSISIAQRLARRAAYIPEYTKTFNFFDAIVCSVVTFTLGAKLRRSLSADPERFLAVTCLDQPRYSASFKMPKDDKASAAAAQLLIDDEPDDWCVEMWGFVDGD